MFSIYSKRVKSPKYGEGTPFDRYFHKWENAQKEMDEEVDEWLKEGAKIVRSWDEMNVAKGFYVYQKNLIWETEEGTYEGTFAVVDGYFQDE